MDDIEELVRLARASAEEVVSVATELLAAGMDIKHVQDRYVVVAVELLTDVEAWGLLAAGGNQDALITLESAVDEFAALRDRARAASKRSRDH